MELPINDEQRVFARTLGQQVNKFHLGFINYNCINKTEENYIGFLGEVVLCDYLKQARPKVGECLDFDHVVNGFKVNLKISSYFGPNTYLKVRCGYSKVGFDGYLLGHIPRSKDRLYLLGYISKTDFNNKKQVKNFGYYDTDVVSLDQMQPIGVIDLPLEL